MLRKPFNTKNEYCKKLHILSLYLCQKTETTHNIYESFMFRLKFCQEHMIIVTVI